MKYLSLFLLATGISVSTQAKSWRINNIPGVAADFNSFSAAVTNASVSNGDTLYFEPSSINYGGSATLNKRLVIIGPGYFLDPANTTTPGNTGLQATTDEAYFNGTLYITADGALSKIMGMTLSNIYLQNAANVTFERVRFNSGPTIDGGACTDIVFRKCYFTSGAISERYSGQVSGLVVENSIFNGAYINLSTITGSNNIVRNNTFWNGANCTLVNTYFVNNIVATQWQFNMTNCTIKNNIWQVAQVLPNTATGNVLSQNMADVFEGTGSHDGRFKLKAGSPAIGKGLSVGTVTNPDCGAFGATDPYVLSGIPNVPTIYSLTAPTSIPSGSTTMNVTFSTRNNN